MRSFHAIFLILVCVLLLHACGGGSSSDRSSSAPPSADPPPPLEPPQLNPSGDYTMPPLALVLAPESEFEGACANSEPSKDEIAAPPVAGDTTGANRGVLLDAAVSGVAYQTASIQGVTDADGNFDFQDGEKVAFSLGETTLGEVAGRAQVTPFDLAGAEVPSGMDAITNALGYDDTPFHAVTNSPFHRVINTAVLLQSLDEDADPRNGISITPESAALFDGVDLELEQNRNSFTREYLLARTLTAANNGGLFSVTHGAANPARAMSHLYATLGVEAHTFGISLEQFDWDGDGISNDFTRYQYDADGNLVLVESSYDEGWHTSVETRTYDTRGKLVGVEQRELGEQSNETWIYLASGELWKHERDENDNGVLDSIQTWSYEYNLDGSIRQATMVSEQELELEDEPVPEPSSAVVTFQYNSNGKPQQIAFQGDSLHLAAAQLDLPVIGYLEYAKTYVISYEYNASGKLVADTLEGRNPELGYRIVTRRFDEQGSLTYYEDHLKTGEENDEQVTVRNYSYEYDAKGRVVKKSEDEDGDGKTDQILSYEYDADGRLIKETYQGLGLHNPDEIVYYSYDQHGAVVRIERDDLGDGSIDYVELRPYEYRYDDNGRIIHRSLELNGEAREVIDYSWHPDGALAREEHWVRDIDIWQEETWQYDALGRLLREQIDYEADGTAERVTRYGYDACGGLVSREVFDLGEPKSLEETWQYDASGRLRYHEWKGANAMPEFEHNPFPPGLPLFPSEGFERWQYGPDNRPVYYQFECGGDCFLLVDVRGDGPLPLPDQIINWEYDEAGRVTRELVDENGDGRADRVTFYEFNDAGKVTRELVDTTADGSPNEAVFYQYDASGRLLRRYVDENGNGIIDAGDVTEYNSRGNVTAQYSEYYNLGLVENASSFNHYYDENGNHTRMETDRDTNGTIDEIEEWNYDASGILLSRKVEVLDANPPGSVETWLYDSRGNVTRREYDDDGNGVPEQRTTYDYDAHGNLLREASGYSFDGDGVMEETESREYVPTGWGHILNGEQG